MDDAALPPAPQPTAPMAMPMTMPMAMPGFGMPGFQQARSPGRPNLDPGAQAERDKRNAAMTELETLLPKNAKEYRFQVYKVLFRNGAYIQKSTRPTDEILMSEWKEAGLSDAETFRAWLSENLGPGAYKIRVCDAHGTPTKHPSWVEDLMQGQHMDDMNSPRGRGSRGRFSRGRADDFGDDEFFDDDDIIFMDEPRRGSRRGDGVADFLATTKASEAAAAQVASAQANAQAQQSQETMRLFVAQSQSQREADERRRSEERAAEERRRDERRTDERNAEERRRAEESRAEERRREERREDERRREEERKDDRLREERKSQERMQLIIGAISAATAMIPTLLNKPKDDSLTVLLSKMAEPKGTDPVIAAVLSKLMEANNSKSGLDQMLAGFVEMQRMGSTMQAESMKSTMALTQELQAKAISQLVAATKGGGEEGIMDKITKMLPALAPALPAIIQAVQQPSPAAPAQQVRPAVTAAPQAPVQQAQPVPAAPASTSAAAGYDTVVRGLIALHQKQYQTETQRQQIMDIMIQNMPPDLKMAIAQGDMGKITEVMTPTFTGNPQYLAWLGVEGAQAFIMDTAAGFQPMLAQQLGVTLAPEQPETPAPAPAVAPAPVTAPVREVTATVEKPGTAALDIGV